MNKQVILASASLGILGAIGVVRHHNFIRAREQRLIEKEEKNFFDALEKFAEANSLYEDDFTWVSDSGLTPIVTYDKLLLDLETASVPKGYVLHKLFHSNGAVTYAIGTIPSFKEPFTDYHILFYLVEKNEWFEGIRP